MADLSRPPSLIRLYNGLGLLALIVLTAMSFSPNSATRFYAWPWHFYWKLLLLAPIAWLGVMLLLGVRLPRFGGVLDVGLAVGFVLAIASALLGEFAWQSLNAALIPAATIAAAYAVLSWLESNEELRHQHCRWLEQGLGVFAALFVAVSLSTWWLVDVWPVLGKGTGAAAAFSIRNTHPFGHSTYVAGFAVLVTPWLAILGLSATGRARIFWLALAALALFTVPTTGSRGGVLGVVALVAGGLLSWLQRASLSRRIKLALILGALGIAAIFVGADPRLRHLVREGSWSDTASESNQQRVAMAGAGWRMGRDHWLIGNGPGTTPLLYPRYRAKLDGGVDSVLQLHNTPLQVWADYGLAGLLLGLALVAGTVALAARAWRHPAGDGSDHARLLRSRGIPIALAAYALFALTDYQLDVPAFASTIVVYLALLRTCAGAPGESAVTSRSAFAIRRGAGVAVLAGLIAMMWAVVPDLRARSLFSAAADARAIGDERTFVTGAETAAAAAPWEPFYLVQLAAFHGEKSLQSGTASERSQAAAEAVAALRRALERNPDQEYCHFNLGWLLLANAPAEAERHFRAAARLVPDKGGVYYGIGLSYLARQDQVMATKAFALEWLNNPRSIAYPLWESARAKALRADVVTALHQWHRTWRDQPALSVLQQRQLDYVAALVDWWPGTPETPQVLLENASTEQQAFFQHLTAIEQRVYAPAAPAHRSWEQLYLLWKDGMPQAAGVQSPFAAALGARLAEQRSSFVRVITAPLGQDARLTATIRNERPGYSVLAGNQDGFPLRDLYLYPENLVVSGFASFLFPRKGYLPAPLLHASLSSLSSSR